MDLANTLNRHSPIPLHYQLRQVIKQQIENGEYQSGDRLPSESNLSDQYGVSRQVVRQALKGLIQSGQIIVQQGSGYFVEDQRIRKKISTLRSHTESLREICDVSKTIVIECNLKEPPLEVSQKMNQKPGEPLVYLERLSLADSEPNCVISAYYPRTYKDCLLNNDLTNRSVYQLFSEQFGIHLYRAETTISIAFADQHLGNLLEIREGSPLLKMDSYTWDSNEQLFEFSSGYYRGDRFELSVEQRLAE
jgi:GntR family transcriptional regulator